MRNYTYTLTTNQSATENSITLLQDITGTNLVNFSFSNIDETKSKVNKIIIDTPYGEELTLVRELTGTQTSLSTKSVDVIIESEFIDQSKKSIIVSLQRNDGLIDTYEVEFTVFKPTMNHYEDINLLETDFFSNEENDNNLLLSFATRDPDYVGLSLIDDIDPRFFNPENIFTPTTACSAKTGFIDEYVIVNSWYSNTHNLIKVKKDGDSCAEFQVKYKTDIGIGTTGFIPGTDSWYYPATAFTNYIPTSGVLNWYSGDEDYKIINVPIVDTGGGLNDFSFKVNGNYGVGTSSFAKRDVYFTVELFDLTSCDNVSFTNNTMLTAFINY